MSARRLAVVVADTRHIAEDGAALVAVDYEPLPAIVACGGATSDDAPLAHVDSPDNIAAQLRVSFGDVDDAFAKADHVFEETLHQHRGGCHAMECRGVIAEDRPHHDGLTIWSSTQCPYLVRRNVAAYLDRDEGRVRVVAPDVGGGFGPKAGVYCEEIVIPLAAAALGRPVKWIEDRREHFVTTNTQRATALVARGRGRRQRQDDRRARQGDPRLRRLRALWPAAADDLADADAGSVFGARARRVLGCRVHQHDAEFADPRRRPAQRRVRNGAPDRARRPRAEHRPGRGAAAQLRPARPVPLRHRPEVPRRVGDQVRQRRLRGVPRKGAGGRRLRRFRRAPGRGADRGTVHRHRRIELHRGYRGRPVRGRDGAHPAGRQGAGADGRGQPGPGPRHHAGASLRRPSSTSRSATSMCSRPTPARSRRAWAPSAAASRSTPAPPSTRPPTRCAKRRSSWPPRCSRRRPRILWSRTA